MLNDLYKTLQHIDESITSTAILNLYAQLINLYRQAAQSYTPETDQQIKETLKQITEAHQQIEPSGWTNQHRSIFNQLNKNDAVGLVASQRLVQAINGNAANLQGAIHKIEELRQYIEQLQQNSKSILKSLDKPEEEELDVPREYELVEIVFEEGVAIENIVELNENSKSWQTIIRAFSLLAKEAPEKTKIIKASKNSPFFLILSAPPLIARAIKATISPLLDIRQQYLETELTKAELDKKKKLNEAIAKELDKMHADEENAQIERISKEVVANYKAEGLGKADENEASNNIVKAIAELSKFINAGGKVDVSTKENGDTNSSVMEFAVVYRKINELEFKVKKQLGDGRVRKQNATGQKKVETVTDEEETTTGKK